MAADGGSKPKKTRGSTADLAMLADRISRRRQEIQMFLTPAERHFNRLLTLVIIASTTSATLTAAPALGGKSFTDWLAATFGLTAPAWQLLCGVAALCSLSGAIATQSMRSRGTEERIVRCQTALARLHILEASLTVGNVTPDQALSEYSQCVQETAFVGAALPRQVVRGQAVTAPDTSSYTTSAPVSAPASAAASTARATNAPPPRAAEPDDGSPTVLTVPPPALLGKWINVKVSAKTLDLQHEGSFVLTLPSGAKQSGHFTAVESTLTMKISDTAQSIFTWSVVNNELILKRKDGIKSVYRRA